MLQKLVLGAPENVFGTEVVEELLDRKGKSVMLGKTVRFPTEMPRGEYL